jgi:hypothetical protein
MARNQFINMMAGARPERKRRRFATRIRAHPAVG